MTGVESEASSCQLYHANCTDEEHKKRRSEEYDIENSICR